MAGLGPPIHDFDFGVALKSWMPAPSAGMTSVREAPEEATIFGCFKGFSRR
jgi:hypothetical protein